MHSGAGDCTAVVVADGAGAVVGAGTGEVVPGVGCPW
jgi:hypothetical protein